MSFGLLYLSSEGDHLYRVDGQQLHPVDLGTPFQRLQVIADYVEEALLKATLPRMMGRDMSALVERRLQAEFRETPYRSSARLGPGKAEKSVDYLFQALPVAPRLDGQLRPRLDAGCAIESVRSVSLLTALWARRAGIDNAQRLVVLPTPAGVRHVFLDRGQAVLSRLTNSAASGNEGGQALRDELERTVQYLYNARLVDRGNEIASWIWGNSAACGQLEQQRVPGLRWERVAPARGMSDPASEGFIALFKLAAAQRGGDQFAPDPIRLHHFARQLRRGMLMAAAAASLLLLALAGNALLQTRRSGEQHLQLQAQTHRLQSEQALLQGQLAEAAADAETVRAAIATRRSEIEQVADFKPTLIAVSRAFEGNAAFQLDALQWRVDAGADPSASLEPTGALCPDPWPQPEDGSEPLIRPRSGLRLSGRVSNELSLRDAVSARERFEAQLRAAGRWQLRTAAAPIDISGGGVIRGGAQAAGDARAFDYCLSQAPP